MPVLLEVFFRGAFSILFGASCYVSYSKIPRKFTNVAQKIELSYYTPLKSPPEDGNSLITQQQRWHIFSVQQDRGKSPSKGPRENCLNFYVGSQLQVRVSFGDVSRPSGCCTDSVSLSCQDAAHLSTPAPHALLSPSDHTGRFQCK